MMEIDFTKDSKDIKQIDKNEKTKIFNVFSTRGQIENFYKEQPFYYDKSRIFWLWNEEFKKWEISDEIDFLNLIQKSLGIDTINSKKKTELIEGFKQVGRDKKPKDFEKTWIQFKDTIVDIKTGEEFMSSHKYFSLNPLPYSLGENEETPNIDKLFIEWVSEKNIIDLQELNAYVISNNQFMQRMFALCGGGSNGKGTFMKFTKKLIGDYNCVASELKNLSEDKFEPAVLYGKILCVMGEVSQSDLKNTNMIKKIAGEDDLSFQFKGKTPFTGENTATAVCLTNSLPTTPDKTMGFYRKWQIIDFPNQFNGVKRDLISEIPEKEFENYMLKCVNILKNLYKTNKFKHEGNFQERMERYEERSNPLMRFIEEYCEEDYEAVINIKDFGFRLNKYLKDRHLRMYTKKEVKKSLLDEDFEVKKGTKNYVNGVYIYGLDFKKTKNMPFMPNMPKNSTQILYSNLVEKNGIKGIKGIKQENIEDLLIFFKENQERVINLDEIQNFFKYPESKLEQLKKEGLIYEPKPGLYQYLG